MDIGGVNSLNFMPQPKADGVKPNQEKAGQSQPSSFGKLLKSKDEAASQPQPAAQNTQPRTQSEAQSQSQSQSQPQAQPQAQSQPQPVSQPNSQPAPASTSAQSQAQQAPPPALQTSAVPVAEQTMASFVPSPPSAPSLGGPIDENLMMDAPRTAAPAVPFETPLGKSPKMSKDDSVDSLTRRVVWHDFLRKMKDELDVSAEDLLSAFAALNEEELAKPPEQTVDKVVMALGLTGHEAEIAKQHLSTLVERTHAPSMGEELAAGQRQISLSLMSQREIQRKAQMSRVDSISDGFKAVDIPKQKTSQLISESHTGESGPAPLMDLLDRSQIAKAQTPNTVDELIRQFNTPQPAQESAIASVGIVAPGMEPGQSGGEEEAEFTSDSPLTAAQHLPGQRVSGLGQTAGSFQNEMIKLTPDQPVAVGELMDKAQVMVTEGGGEMKVVLTPEGLGEVAMRVSVDQGKVNVQMITESDEAKKLIERQLHELKTQLTSNQLQVDTIKIDTATNLGKQLEQQYEDAQRQLAQQTLQQFRQDHQGWRRSFFELPSAKLSKGQVDAPRDVQPPSSSDRRQRSRLDLVA